MTQFCLLSDEMIDSLIVLRISSIKTCYRLRHNDKLWGNNGWKFRLRLFIKELRELRQEKAIRKGV